MKFALLLVPLGLLATPLQMELGDQILTSYGVWNWIHHNPGRGLPTQMTFEAFGEDISDPAFSALSFQVELESADRSVSIPFQREFLRWAHSDKKGYPISLLTGFIDFRGQEEALFGPDPAAEFVDQFRIRVTLLSGAWTFLDSTAGDLSDYYHLYPNGAARHRMPELVKAEIPEPSTFLLLGLGLVGLPVLRRLKS